MQNIFTACARLVAIGACLLVGIFSLNAQIGASYYSFGKSVSLSTNPSTKIWLELRLNTDVYDAAKRLDKGIPHLHMMINAIQTERADLYFGAGLGYSIFQSTTTTISSQSFVSLPMGLQIRPFEKLPELHLTGEFLPLFLPIKNKQLTSLFGVSWGIRYNFGEQFKREKEEKPAKKKKRKKRRRRLF